MTLEELIALQWHDPDYEGALFVFTASEAKDTCFYSTGAFDSTNLRGGGDLVITGDILQLRYWVGSDVRRVKLDYSAVQSTDELVELANITARLVGARR